MLCKGCFHHFSARNSTPTPNPEVKSLRPAPKYWHPADPSASGGSRSYLPAPPWRGGSGKNQLLLPSFSWLDCYTIGVKSV